MEENAKHTENVYAYDEHFKEIYIGDVDPKHNGIKKMYLCLGCQKQMQAVKPKTLRKQHFRHHVTKNSNQNKCTYSDETHRHFLAKANALVLKEIKLPSVYKYPPKNTESNPVLLSESKTIKATDVLLEHWIYENEIGEIKIAKNLIDNEDKFLKIKPDAIFLNQKGEPILLIEFVATHKPDEIKMMKFRRLGIDTIQVTVPKSSPEEIRNIFFRTTNTKWLFNKLENQSEYHELSSKNAGGVPEIDFEQGKLFEEGFNCRKAHLGDFIRSIERFLESEQYQSTKQQIESEIRRVEENTIRDKAELDRLQKQYIGEGIEQHNERREELIKATRSFKAKYGDLEKRYIRKKQEIESEERAIESEEREIESAIRKHERTQSETDRKGDDIEREIIAANDSISKLQQQIGDFGQLEESEYSTFEKSRSELENAIEAERNKPTELKDEITREIESIKDEIELEIERVENRIRKAREKFNRDKEQCEFEAETSFKQSATEIENGSFKRFPWFIQEYEKLDEYRNCLMEYQSIEEDLSRVEKKEREYLEKKQLE